MAGSILLVVVVLAGALAGERLGPPARILGILGALGLLASSLGSRLVLRLRSGRSTPTVAAVTAVAAAGCLACASMQGALRGLERPALASLASLRAEVVVGGRVVEASARRWGRAHLVVRAAMLVPVVDRQGFEGEGAGAGRPLSPPTAASVVATDGARILVEASGPLAGRLSVLASGEELVLVGALRPLRGSERRLRWRHVGVGLAVSDLVSIGPATAPLDLVANRLRATVEAGLSRLGAPERGVLAGLLIGDRRELGVELAVSFRDSGLAHLLSVSGANVALVLGLAGPLLRRLGILGRLAGGLLLLIVFGAVTSFEPSVLRASAMAALALAAAFLGRPAPGIRLLALGVSAMAIVDPFLLRSVGFVESAAASAGILFLAGPFARRLRGPHFVREVLAVTAAAQIGVAPVVLPIFGALPLVALPANLAVAPLVALVASFGLLAALGAGIVGEALPAVADLAVAPPALAARYLVLVAEVASRHPLEVTGRGVLGLLSIGCLLGALRVPCSWMRRRSWRRRRGRRDGRWRS